MYSAHHAAARLRTLAFAFALSCTALHAQSPGSVHGSILDPQGASVPSASIDLLEDGKPLARATSSPTGTFVIPLPHAGRFALRVAAPGFQATTSPADFLSQSAALDVTLATQTLTQQVTVTANGTPTPEAQVGVAVTVLSPSDAPNQPELQDPLRLVTGLQLTQTGQIGGSTALRIRGASSDANKVLLDGVPVGQIGGLTEFANLASTGIASIEVLREANSAIFGTDAEAGVVDITSTRASSAPLPLFTYAGDGGNLRTYRNEVTAGESLRQFDLFSAFSRMDTRNGLPNSKFHNATYAGNFGFAPNPDNDLRFTLRKVWNSAGSPNAIVLYGIPDDAQQKEQDSYYSGAYNSQTTPRWHNQLRFASQRLDAQSNSFGATGLPDSLPQFASTYSYQSGYFNGRPVTIAGANGFKTSGTAIFQYSNAVTSYQAHTSRDIGSLQSDLRLTPHLLALAAIQYKKESGYNHYSTAPITALDISTSSYTLQLSGDIARRLFFNVGSGLEENGIFGFAASPRASLAFYAFPGTKLHGSFGKGIKEASVYDVQNALYPILLTGAPKAIKQFNVSPIGPEDSRTFDAGLDQQLLNGRVRLGVTWFHSEFTNQVEYVSTFALFSLLGLPNNAATLAAFPQYFYGAYVNSGAFRSEGVEFESEAKLTAHLFARAGYTYTDARVQHSLTCDNDTAPGDYCGPGYNLYSNFTTTPIGAFSPLIGARPFRVAPHTGYFALNYTQSRWFASLTGSLVSKRDDSTYLGGSDVNFDNSLLLPNRNLLGSYERLDLNAGYNLTPRVNLYTNMQNLLSQHYFEAFGYPSLPLTFRAGIKLNFGGESFKLN